MELNCVIIDDEQTARNGLAEDIKEVSFLKIKGYASNAFEALEKINKYYPELIFLDIEMPGLSGIDFLKLIKVKPMVIITTAYPQFAIDGFEHGVIDFLLKPISMERLLIACDKALDHHRTHQHNAAKTDQPDYCYLKCNGKLEKINYNEILYIEAANNYILVHTSYRRFVTYSSLKSIIDHLPKDNFVRVHKSFVVGREHIRQIDGNHLLIGEVKIPLSRNFKSTFQKDVIDPKVYHR
jgi:two-component system LytT family response regulator